MTPWTVTHQVPWDSPGKNTGVGSHFLLQGMFQTQGSKLCLLWPLHWQMDSLHLSHQGSTPIVLLVKYKFFCMTHPPFMTDPASLFCLLFTPPPLAQNFPHILFQCSFNKHLSISGVAPLFLLPGTFSSLTAWLLSLKI